MPLYSHLCTSNMAKLLCLVFFSLFSVCLCNSTTSPNTTRCLNFLDEIKRHLSSNIPPIDGWITDNYNNISRALFPVFNLPSLYIKITIQFINDSGKLDKNFEKFTWSESPIFVSSKELPLIVMSIFSLGTILPQRRQTELVLTVPRLCENSAKRNNFKNNKEMWIFTLLTLQDIAIVPNVSDPRVNTALAVALGHEGDQDFAESPTHWNDYKLCYWITISSLLLTLPLYWFAYKWIKNCSTPVQKTSFYSVVIFFVLTTFEFLLLIYIQIGKLSYRYFTCHYCLSGLLSILMTINIICITGRLKSEKQVLRILMFPCLYQCIHHLLWVLCGGIPADPNWAIPLFLCESLVIVVLVFAIHLYNQTYNQGNNTNNQDNNTNNQGNNTNNQGNNTNNQGNNTNNKDNKCLKVLHLSLFVVAIWFCTVTMVFSFHYRSVTMSSENFLEIIMAAVLVWLIKKFGLSKK